MPSHILNVRSRAESGSRASRRARSEGDIPAVLYGPGHPARSIVVSSREFRLVLAAQAEEVALHFHDSAQQVTAQVKAVQRNSLKGIVNHIDFLVPASQG
jgi:large subunit ribosomal protein L25